MSENRVRLLQTSRLVVDVLLIVLGTLLLFSVIEFTAPFWLSFVVLCAGAILIFEDPGNRNLRIGIPLALIGLLLTFRSLNIVSVPILRWGLGAFLILTAVVNLYRNLKGGGVAIHKTFQKEVKSN